MVRNSTNQPSQRQLRVAEQIRHIIGETMLRGHFHNPVLMDAGKVTVTEVRISPDLKHATAYVVALGGEDMKELLPALNEAAPVFQKDIGRQAELKFTPKVQFRMDESFDNAQRLEGILSTLKYSEQE
jgi:ribosome-binding factor A